MKKGREKIGDPGAIQLSNINVAINNRSAVPDENLYLNDIKSSRENNNHHNHNNNSNNVDEEVAMSQGDEEEGQNYMNKATIDAQMPKSRAPFDRASSTDTVPGDLPPPRPELGGKNKRHSEPVSDDDGNDDHYLKTLPRNLVKDAKRRPDPTPDSDDDSHYTRELPKKKTTLPSGAVGGAVGGPAGGGAGRGVGGAAGGAASGVVNGGFIQDEPKKPIAPSAASPSLPLPPVRNLPEPPARSDGIWKSTPSAVRIIAIVVAVVAIVAIVALVVAILALLDSSSPSPPPMCKSDSINYDCPDATTTSLPTIATTMTMANATMDPPNSTTKSTTTDSLSPTSTASIVTTTQGIVCDIPPEYRDSNQYPNVTRRVTLPFNGEANYFEFSRRCENNQKCGVTDKCVTFRDQKGDDDDWPWRFHEELIGVRQEGKDIVINLPCVFETPQILNYTICAIRFTD